MRLIGAEPEVVANDLIFVIVDVLSFLHRFVGD
jgi:hypothetical protein